MDKKRTISDLFEIIAGFTVMAVLAFSVFTTFTKGY